MRGTFDKYLDVNLSTSSITDCEIPLNWTILHLGGRGIAARILLEELSGSEDPLSKDSILVFATGPFQGTGMIGAGRHVVMGMSPKTGSIAGSYAGGFFGHELGTSGYDGIIIRGAAKKPVYLSLIDGEAKLSSAGELWGKGTGETETTLKNRHPGARITSIGIAGENLVQMACIINDRSRSAGRPGLGAAMGAKKLKAIAVKGNKKKSLHEPERFRKELSKYAKGFRSEGVKDFGELGTSGGVISLSETGILPTKNFAEGVFDGAEKISGERMRDTILVDRDTCAGCPIRCKRMVRTSFGGREALPEFGGPEYETVAAFGSLCMNDNLDVIAVANQLCNDHGIDTISAGVAAAFLMEASEKGAIDEDIPWGDGEAILTVIEKIAYRKGMGDRIADGLAQFADELGVDFDMTIKGVELPMHEPRGKQGLGISYATSPRGATHMEGMHDTMLEKDAPAPELGVNQSYDRFTLADKPLIAKLYEDVRSFENSLIMCVFADRMAGDSSDFAMIRSLLGHATGNYLSTQEMLEIGERNYALMRLHSSRAGYRIDDDELPRRFSEPLPRGASADHPISEQEMKTAIQAYYEHRGYDDYGPTDERLRSLDLEELVGVIRR